MAKAINHGLKRGNANGKIITMKLIGQFIVRKRKILLAKRSESSIDFELPVTTLAYEAFYLYMNKEQQEYRKELFELIRHCNWSIRIGVLAVLINAFNMYLSWSKVL